MTSIILIVCWFGKLRTDFRFWLKSVEYNPTIDFLFFTDQDIAEAPLNVKIIKSSLLDIEKLAKRKIWEGCIIPKPYKLCDYRPVYGDLFQDYIKEYDFWGHCDIDLILGDIRHFMTEDLLIKHDRLMAEGHFILYRNTSDVNRKYQKIEKPDFEEVFSQQKSYCFDEWPGATGFWVKNHRDKCFLDSSLMDDIVPNVYKFVSYSNRHNDKNRKNIMFSYNKGKLYKYYEENGEVGRKEILYAHFQKRSLKVCTTNTDCFLIIPNKYAPYRSTITKNYLRWYVRESAFWPYMVRFVFKMCTILHIKECRYTKDGLVLVDYESL